MVEQTEKTIVDRSDPKNWGSRQLKRDEPKRPSLGDPDVTAELNDLGYHPPFSAWSIFDRIWTIRYWLRDNLLGRPSGKEPIYKSSEKQKPSPV